MSESFTLTPELKSLLSQSNPSLAQDGTPAMIDESMLERLQAMEDIEIDPETEGAQDGTVSVPVGSPKVQGMALPRPYKTYSQYLKGKFGARVYKVTLDGGFSCPNRNGVKAWGGCTFCDETGSSSRSQDPRDSITDQVQANVARLQRRFRAEKFIAYFQSFTNTYSSPARLKRLYDEAMSAHPDVVGMAISTRPDCVNEEKLQLIKSYETPENDICIEYGMQTIHNRTLERLNRCETHEDFERAMAWTQSIGLHHCVHVILGLPGESWEDQMATADKLRAMNVDGVKIHLLVAMENTPLAESYHRGEWQPIEREAYIQLAADFIDRLHPECIIHRVGGNGHPRHVVAPRWLQQEKQDLVQAIDAVLWQRHPERLKPVHE